MLVTFCEPKVEMCEETSFLQERGCDVLVNEFRISADQWHVFGTMIKSRGPLTVTYLLCHDVV